MQTCVLLFRARDLTEVPIELRDDRAGIKAEVIYLGSEGEQARSGRAERRVSRQPRRAWVLGLLEALFTECPLSDPGRPRPPGLAW